MGYDIARKQSTIISSYMISRTRSITHIVYVHILTTGLNKSHVSGVTIVFTPIELFIQTRFSTHNLHPGQELLQTLYYYKLISTCWSLSSHRASYNIHIFALLKLCIVIMNGLNLSIWVDKQCLLLIRSYLMTDIGNFSSTWRIVYTCRLQCLNT